MIMKIWVLKRHRRAVETILLAVGANKARPYTANILMILSLMWNNEQVITSFQIGGKYEKVQCLQLLLLVPPPLIIIIIIISILYRCRLIGRMHM